jgi:hypothetical protein
MIADYVGQLMDLTIDSDKNIVFSHILEYNNSENFNGPGISDLEY